MIQPGICPRLSRGLLSNYLQVVVVPRDSLITAQGPDVAQEFFQRTLGTLGPPDSKIAQRLTAAFMAVSALGNVVVMTFTASRGSFLHSP
jgi:hypothetical protein